MDPIISVIIPVYNVEKYLRAAIDSVLSQTFRDFVAILVDDGSTDGSGKICDEYAENDPRVKVIHKPNGGLSSARNAGIDLALTINSVKYIAFVDSDDLIKQDYLLTAYTAAKKHGGDIVCFGIEMVDENFNALSMPKTHNGFLRVYKNLDVIKPILPPKSVGDYAVNKLFDKELFIGVRFPEGRIFEDVFTTYKLFLKAKRVVVIKDKNYVYIRHENSITLNKKVNKKIYDFFYAAKEKYQAVSSRCPNLQKRAACCLADSIVVVVRAIGDFEQFENFSEDVEFFRQEAIKIEKDVAKNPYCIKENRLLIKALSESYDKFYMLDNENRNKDKTTLSEHIKGFLCRLAVKMGLHKSK